MIRVSTPYESWAAWRSHLPTTGPTGSMSGWQFVGNVYAWRILGIAYRQALGILHR